MLPADTPPENLSARGTPANGAARVDVPLTSATAAAEAVALAFFAWLGVVTVCAGLLWGVRLVLDRLRYAGWQREWERVGSDRSFS